MANLRAVLVGCGSISGAWLAPISQMPEIELVALVDIQEDAARQRAEEFGLRSAAIGTDLATMLKQTTPDVVFNCTIPEAHIHVTLESLAHGCHVLSEKPMADTMDNARRIVEAAEQAGRLCAVIQNRRYTSQIRRLRHFLASGTLGPITTVDTDFYLGAHFGGFRDRMQHVLLLDMAIHTFDAARLLIDADPVSVFCKEWNPSGSWYDHGASAIAIFEMSNGAVYSYRGSWCTEGLNTTWEGTWRFTGEQGSLTWDGADAFQTQVIAESGGFRSTYHDVDVPPFEETEKVGGHAGLIREFVRCVETGATPETVCSDNIKSLAMTISAIESAQLGSVVDVRW